MDCVAVARHTDRAPVQANTSQSFQLDKGKQVPGPVGLRLIHCFDVFWRCMYRAMREDGTPSKVPDFAYGGIPHRRREFGMIVTRVTAGKLRAARIPFVARSHDGRNAFGCTAHEKIKEKVLPRFNQRDGPSSCRGVASLRPPSTPATAGSSCGTGRAA